MAPSRRSVAANKSRATPKRNKVNESSKDESGNVSLSAEEKPFLLLEDVTCKICLNLMVKPVSLPCQHNLCYSCYLSCVEKSNLACPMCRKRISVWCRQAAKNNTIVNETMWEQIQVQFPELIEAHNEEDKDDKDIEDFFPTAERANANEELERIRLADEALALELSGREDNIRKLRGSTIIQTPPSSRKRPRKTSSDAKSTPAAKKINKFFSSRSNENDEPSRSPSAFVPVTEHFRKKDVSMSEPRSSSCTSLESIDQEVSKRLHFRPINAAPLTPPKNSPGNSEIVKPQVVTAAKNLNQLYGLATLAEEKALDLPEDVNHNSTSDDSVKDGGVLAQELLEMEREWLRKKKEQEEADNELARKLQQELDEESNPGRALVNRSKGSRDEYQLRTKKIKNQPTIEDSFQRPSFRKSNPLP
ncbi:hypothetical protein DAPPUDRAFT_310691 [Daphnia pulex]|uniref:RING-type E3 ubiquitin transferase n=1 Tax=Daphnia pulex TaxID=6669 RepID=E9FV64_DAPPU|nr:hypothetical protein DAPPUDRAFT_310691 [Daphnia pulex]|eukprot:EFX88501.1 hypothetical protein DAPPUDRAFT_310691 [Daphnia pulex]